MPGGIECHPSPITNDWANKGFHIRVLGTELAVVPNHRAGVSFKPVFSSTSIYEVARAIKRAKVKCLEDSMTRQRWMRDADRAIEFMRQYDGVLASKARGRMFEFKMLRIALSRYL
jgi:hypothetical protein